MKEVDLYHCRICGYKNSYKPWGDDGKSPNFSYCPSCGVEFGYQDTNLISIRHYRSKWIENGMKWDSKKEKPIDFNVEKQLLNISKEFL